MGHGYFRSNRQVLEDISRIMAGGGRYSIFPSKEHIQCPTTCSKLVEGGCRQVHLLKKFHLQHVQFVQHWVPKKSLDADDNQSGSENGSFHDGSSSHGSWDSGSGSGAGVKEELLSGNIGGACTGSSSGGSAGIRIATTSSDMAAGNAAGSVGVAGASDDETAASPRSTSTAESETSLPPMLPVREVVIAKTFALEGVDDGDGDTTNSTMLMAAVKAAREAVAAADDYEDDNEAECESREVCSWQGVYVGRGVYVNCRFGLDGKNDPALTMK